MEQRGAFDPRYARYPRVIRGYVRLFVEILECPASLADAIVQLWALALVLMSFALAVSMYQQ